LAVTVAVPEVTAVAIPVTALMFSTALLLLDHVTAGNVAPAGSTVAVKFLDSPTNRCVTAWSISTFETGIPTLTVQLALKGLPGLPGSVKVAVMVAVPALPLVTVIRA